MTKYILIPEYAPLYAMHSCFGPEHGPLTQPTRTPIDVIGGLLMQTGREKVTIYEVIPTDKPKIFSDPVRLTLENYRLPYEEIAGMDPADESKTIVMKEPIPVTPVVTDPVVVPSSPVVEEPENSVVETTEDITNTEIKEEKVTPVTDPVDEVPETETPIIDTETAEVKTESTPNPYAGMTKAERRAARRAAAAEAAEKAAQSSATTFEDEPINSEE